MTKHKWVKLINYLSLDSWIKIQWCSRCGAIQRESTNDKLGIWYQSPKSGKRILLKEPNCKDQQGGKDES